MLGAACVACGNAADRFKCPGCAAPYCGPECFKREWKGHRVGCRQAQARRAGEEYARTESRGYALHQAGQHGDLRKIRKLVDGFTAVVAKTKYANEAEIAMRTFLDFIDGRFIGTAAYVASSVNRHDAVRLLHGL